MLIHLIRNTVVNGVAWEAGSVVDTDPATAGYLIAIGKAREEAAVVHTAPEKAQMEAPERAVPARPRTRRGGQDV